MLRNTGWIGKTGKSRGLPKYLPPAKIWPLSPFFMKSRVNTVLGWVFAGIAGAFTLFSGVMEFIMPMNDPAVVEFVTKVGITDMEYYLGAAKLVIGILFLIPRTSTVGFVLMVGYFSGALAANITHQVSFAEYSMLIIALAIITISGYFRNPELLSRLMGRPVPTV